MSLIHRSLVLPGPINTNIGLAVSLKRVTKLPVLGTEFNFRNSTPNLTPDPGCSLTRGLNVTLSVDAPVSHIQPRNAQLKMPERVSAKSNGHGGPTCLTRPLVRGKSAGQQLNENIPTAAPFGYHRREDEGNLGKIG
jgi:hypothetical protein